MHAIVVHPRVDRGCVVRAGVVLQEAPQATRVETLISWLEIVLQDITIQLAVYFAQKEPASPDSLGAEAAPERDGRSGLVGRFAVLRLVRCAGRALHPHLTMMPEAEVDGDDIRCGSF